ncbi:hypothetical protein Hypma_005570 [Hypsizygus marmoreus]|uniref:Uncharacterized protein n=1 Tax=Hypsizygus marmoreus TaxID=39966 RepID=A0A369JZ50_HYPMA|nr:hypothetical protein Hypma_005570 [Hypsizygus marmoreus]
MADSRRFVFVYPTGQRFGKASSTTGIYSAMLFCHGGRARTPFPINIECDNAENARHLLTLMQPIADQYHTTPSLKLISILEGLQEWKAICSFMDSLTDTFFVVSLGWRIGIFITRAGAAASLNGCNTAQKRDSAARNRSLMQSHPGRRPTTNDKENLASSPLATSLLRRLGPPIFDSFLLG